MRRSEPLGHGKTWQAGQSPAIPYKYLEMSIESGKIIYLYYIYTILHIQTDILFDCDVTAGYFSGLSSAVRASSKLQAAQE